MSVVVQQVIDRSRQAGVQDLETEYFRWVNAELEGEFGIRLDVEAMIARDLAELQSYLPPRGALFLAADADDLVGMIFLTPIRSDTARSGACTSATATADRAWAGRCSPVRCKPQRHRLRTRPAGKPQVLGRRPFCLRAHGFRTVPAYPESEVPEHLRQYWILGHRPLTPPSRQTSPQSSWTRRADSSADAASPRGVTRRSSDEGSLMGRRGRAASLRAPVRQGPASAGGRPFEQHPRP